MNYFKKYNSGAFKLVILSACFLFSLVSGVSAELKQELAEEYRAKGYEAYQRGHLDTAVQNFTKAATLGLKSAALFNDMGVLYEDMQMLSRAEQFYISAISVDPQFLPTYSNLAYLYLNLNKEEMAIQNFKKRFELSMLSDEWTEKAKDELLKISPSYQRWISTIEAKRLGDEILRKQRQRFKTNLIRSREFYLLGEKLFDQGKPKEAVKHYNMALKYTPANPKIVKARKIAIVALTEEHIKMGTEQALRQLSIGDSKSAKHEIQKILATMPSESINQFK